MMARFPKRFIWRGDDDSDSTHLALKKNQEFDSSLIGDGILARFLADGKLEFIPDDVLVKLPPDIILQVQSATIGLSSLIEKVKAGIQKAED